MGPEEKKFEGSSNKKKSEGSKEIGDDERIGKLAREGSIKQRGGAMPEVNALNRKA